MLVAFTLACMLLVAYWHWQEGLFSAAAMLACVFLAGLLAFNFFEPLAGLFEGFLERGFLQGYEDFVCLVGLFAFFLAVLRGITHSLNPHQVEFPPVVNQIGAGVVALATGYFVSAILVCAMQTLPWHPNFLGFEPYHENEIIVRRYLPGDRVWLALMHRAGANGFARDGHPTFDAEGSFEVNYLRFRREPTTLETPKQ